MARELTGKQKAFLSVLFDEAGGNMVKELLDRVGLVKTEKMQVEASGGVMLMPPKAPVEDDD